MEGFESLVGVNFWTALFTLCNMIITFLLLKKFLFKPVKKMIDDRQNEIDGLFTDAKNSADEAEALKKRYQAQLDAAGEERERIIKEATARGVKREEEIVGKAKQEASAVLEKAKTDIEREKKKAVNEIKNDISAIAADIAEKIVEKEIDPDKQTELVNSFIDGLGDAL